MPFVVINRSNNFDSNAQKRFATEAEADQAAREILKSFPTNVVETAELLKEYKAVVSVEAADVPEMDPEPEAPAAE